LVCTSSGLTLFLRAMARICRTLSSVFLLATTMSLSTFSTASVNRTSSGGTRTSAWPVTVISGGSTLFCPWAAVADALRIASSIRYFSFGIISTPGSEKRSAVLVHIKLWFSGANLSVCAPRAHIQAPATVHHVIFVHPDFVSRQKFYRNGAVLCAFRFKGRHIVFDRRFATRLSGIGLRTSRNLVFPGQVHLNF